MGWEHEARYRFRSVRGEHTIRRIASTGTVTIEVLWECVRGPNAGATVRWQGYLNSEKNVDDAIWQLRAMGWTGQRFGEWAGMGSCEFEGVVMLERNEGKTFARGAFARAPQTVRRGEDVGADVLGGLNARFGALLAPARDVAAPASTGDADDADLSFP